MKSSKTTPRNQNKVKSTLHPTCSLLSVVKINTPSTKIRRFTKKKTNPSVVEDLEMELDVQKPIKEVAQTDIDKKNVPRNELKVVVTKDKSKNKRKKNVTKTPDI
jgi:RNase adaptor protein for sRNA GlmZ degradation